MLQPLELVKRPFDEAACRRFLYDGLEALCAEKDLARRWLSLTCASVHVALVGLFLMQRVESEADGSQNTKTGRRKELCAIGTGDVERLWLAVCVACTRCFRSILWTRTGQLLK